MHSTLNPMQTDPRDVLEIAPDIVLVARADKAHDAMIPPSDSRTRMGSDFSAGPSVLPVDTMFRAAAVNNVQVPGDRLSIGARATRAFIGFLLAVCIGVAGIVWQAYGDAVKQMVASWAPQFVLTSSLPLEKLGLPEQPSSPAVQTSAAKAAPPQQAPLAQTTAEGVAPTTAAVSPESAQSLQSMARELASLKEEIEQLKGSQQQMSRDIAKTSEAKASDAKASEAKVSDAKASEQNPRPRMSAPPRRWAAAPARRPMPSYPPPQYPPPQAAVAAPLPQAVAPYVPQQPEPQPQARAQPEAELVPRPPMPVR